MELQQTTVPELYLPNPPNPSGGLAYLLPRGSAGAPASLSPAESWAAWAGAYLFSSDPPPPGGERDFAEAAWRFLEDPRSAGPRFAWIETPARPAPFSGSSIAIAGTGEKAYVDRAANLALGSVAVALAAGLEVALGDDEAFEFSGPAGGLRLLSRWGSAELGSVGPEASLPLSGPHAGCLLLKTTFALDDPAAIHVGMRWFYAVPPSPARPTDPAEDFFLASLGFPLLSGERSLYACLDPLAPLDGDRTFLAFAAADAGQSDPSPEPASISSYLRTVLGRTVALRPLSGAVAPGHFAGLVFAREQLASATSPRDAFYLNPRGDFALEPDPDRQLMCGLSGVEYLEPVDSGDATTETISFFPDLPAYARGFYPGKEPGYGALSPASTPTTSYAQVGGGGSTTYFAQPDQSVLYNHGQFAPGGFTALAAVAVEAGGLGEVASPATSFPLLPYAGVVGAPGPFAQLESQIVSPLRRSRIAASAKPAAPPVGAAMELPTSRLATTPQGLLAAYRAGVEEWEEVVLGRMANGALLKLTGIKGDLLGAFRSNKMFLVVSLPEALTIPPGASQIVFGEDASEQWTFDLEAPRWRGTADSPTILILKFHDLSIADLVKEPAAWASAPTFNRDPAEIAGKLTAAIARADGSDPDYAGFLAAVEDPHWNGILALNVECPLEKLPSQLSGLAAGIDPQGFYAHHLGIALSDIDTGGEELAISSSSIFGLLHYGEDGPPQPGPGEYSFRVRDLKVSFAQSAVIGFSSLVDLQVNVLFGEPATLVGQAERDNTIELFGVYQKHEAAGQVEESYVFQTRSGESSIFAIESAVLNAVTVTKGQFVTLAEKDASGQTVTRFIFWGRLDFRALDGFDAFSFGRPANGVGEEGAPGIAFGNLMVTMSFDPGASAQEPWFEFDATKLSLDVAAGTPARPASLFDRFPLAVAGFTQGAKGTTPEELGLMGVQTPLSQASVTYPWFALDYHLDLGSPGALAAETGFTASLSIAWMPNRDGYRVFTGLRLPGSSGARRQISIEGVFDIGFRTLAIVSPTPGTYALLLYGIGFEVFGFTFPPVGQVNFVLFGDPDPSAKGETTIAWYAAYAKKPGTVGR